MQNKPELDRAFLEYILQLDAILRTTGWEKRRALRYSAVHAIEALAENGFDTVVAAILRGYGVNREQLFRATPYSAKDAL